MRILLSSANRSVIKRWTGHLSGTYQVETVPSLQQLQEGCARDRFDIVLVHRALVDRKSFSALLNNCQGARFFLLSDRPDETEGLEFLKRGIVGYANAYIGRERLLEAIRTISNGSVWVGQRIIQRLIAEAQTRAKTASLEKVERQERLASLTAREQEIARKVAQGHSNSDIAADLAITERTVKAHLTAIYEKTGAGNRLSLALLVNQG
jgi:two-component system, NarL family, nitrate/nitrite response regulator NarL